MNAEQIDVELTPVVEAGVEVGPPDLGKILVPTDVGDEGSMLEKFKFMCTRATNCVIGGLCAIIIPSVVVNLIAAGTYGLRQLCIENEDRVARW